MREWSLKSGDPLSLILAADARLGVIDYFNDQIWEFSIGGGTPPAMALQTTFGLRAKAYRLFPIFKEEDTEKCDPAEFIKAPVIQQIFPNYLLLACTPLPDIDVVAEYWVPESHAIAGRLKITNRRKSPRKLQVDWVGLLSPTEGQRMAPLEVQATRVLAGQSGGLALTLFLTGGPLAGTGSYPSLTLPIELLPETPYLCNWAQSALANPEDSFNLAREIASQKWEAVQSRNEMINASQIEIHTGDPDWDATLMLAQKTAAGLFVGPTDQLPGISFTQTRLPDQGYSLRGDGSDYNYLWNGQSPLEAYYLAGMILPAHPELAKGLLSNFLAVQTGDGSIDWKPGLAGQRSRLAATPMLASLAWRIFEFSDDLDFLKEVFPGLLKFLLSWFTPQHDRDRDGIPEWDHVLQSGFEDHPTYSHWHEWSLGLDITTSESPTLCAFLYRETQVLLRMARLLGHEEHQPTLGFLAMRLQVAVDAAWDAQECAYFDWDRDTHTSTSTAQIGQWSGSGTFAVNIFPVLPTRLLLHIQTGQVAKPHPAITVYGEDRSGYPVTQEFSEEKLKWHLSRGRMTGENIFSYIDRVEVQGLEASDTVTIYAAGNRHLDSSTLLPLWANLPDEPHSQLLVKKTITNHQRFWRDFGLPNCAHPPDHPQTQACTALNLPWNTLIGEGLVNYGYRQEAAELVLRLFSAVNHTLKHEGAFRRSYDASTGQGMGERNALNGLAPLGLFMDVLGVRLISPYRVALSGFNPYPWAVTVKYRGLTVLRQKEKTIVIFPDGQTVVVNDPNPQIISLEMSPVAPRD